MQFAYLILAHKTPDQIARLIDRLNGPGASFFIHLDRRAAPDLDRQIVAQVRSHPHLTFVKRHPCYWGAFSIVRATLECIGAAVTSGVDFDRAFLLSGQDYPIKSLTQIEAFLGQHRDREFMEYFALEQPNRWTHQDGAYQALNRVLHWHFRFRSRHFYLPFKRRFPKGLAPYGGSQWWCLSRDCLQYIHQFVQTRRDVVNYFRFVFIPDENFLQTIVANSPFGERLYNDDLKFIDWDNPNPTPPAILEAPDLERLKASPKLFARKFDFGRDREIFDLIDCEIFGDP